MVKNLAVNSETKHKVNKFLIHRVIGFLKKDLLFDISSLTVNFVSAAKITEINKNYLKHYYSTDIITFNYSANLTIIDAEIYISADDAQDNANKYKNSYNDEILRLVIHGILHVSGYNDKKRNEKLKMKRMENKLLKKYKITLMDKKDIL
ncbi:MAG: rRNA maturation RNase YbeY [Ignavibacteriaceae bacterium]